MVSRARGVRQGAASMDIRSTGMRTAAICRPSMATSSAILQRRPRPRGECSLLRLAPAPVCLGASMWSSSSSLSLPEESGASGPCWQAPRCPSSSAQGEALSNCRSCCGPLACPVGRGTSAPAASAMGLSLVDASENHYPASRSGFRHVCTMTNQSRKWQVRHRCGDGTTKSTFSRVCCSPVRCSARPTASGN